LVQIAILNQHKQIIYSTISDEIILDSIDKAETVLCDIKHTHRRQIRIKDLDFDIILICYNQNITNKIFKHYVDAVKLLMPLILKTNREVTDIELKKTRRLKHNIISYTTKIQQELFKLIPQETVAKGARNQLSLIENIISKHIQNAAYAYLKILKNVNFLRAEFAAYEMLNNEKGNYIIDVQNHAIFKVIHLSLSSFWLDFIEKDILVTIEPCSKNLHFDYNSVSVSFSHIFDNAVKYACPETNITISLREESNKFIVNISMISMKIYPEEVQKIFNDGYSGILADKLQLNGSGIGMNIIQKLLKINAIDISLKVNTNPIVNKTFEGCPYEKNEIELIFPNN